MMGLIDPFEYAGRAQDAHEACFPSEVPPSKEELIEFVNYCLDFYGRGGIYDYGFRNFEVFEALHLRWNYKPSLPFDGDSVDREIVRDLVLEMRERKAA